LKHHREITAGNKIILVTLLVGRKLSTVVNHRLSGK
jgi:hypothetical protein